MGLALKDDGRTVQLAPGQVVMVSLKSNPTTGYRWVLADSALGVLAREGEPAYYADSTGGVGAGGFETWRFRAIHPGRGAIVLDYQTALGEGQAARDDCALCHRRALRYYEADCAPRAIARIMRRGPSGRNPPCRAPRSAHSLPSCSCSPPAASPPRTSRPPSRRRPRTPGAHRAPGITDIDWNLAALGERTNPLGNGGRPVTLRLDSASGRAAGNGGCNRYSASYSLRGDSLSFGPGMSTKMACPDGMDLEDAWLKTLPNVVTFAATETTLTLNAAEGPVASFRK